MKTLFICCTDYQLINAINIKKNLLQNDNADIVILNNKAGVFELAKRLQTVNLFQNVYVYSEKFYGIHKYFQNSISFFEIALDGRTFKRKILIK